MHITEAYEAYIKEHEVTYKTEVTTVVEPRVGDVPPVFTNELEKEHLLIQRKMAKQTQMMQSFTSEQVCKALLQFQLSCVLYPELIMLSFHRSFRYLLLSRGSCMRLSVIFLRLPTKNCWLMMGSRWT